MQLTAQFNRCARGHEDSYALSTPYYLLTGRKGISVYSQNDALVIVCRHPHIEGRLMVFPEIGGDGTLTLKVLNALQAPENGIQLARYTQADFEKLQNAAASAPVHGRHFDLAEHEENVMDWKYPVHILNTQNVAGMNGGQYEKLRNKYNKACPQLEVIGLEDPNAIKIMRASLMFWAGTMIYAGKESGHDLTGFYETLFRHMQDFPDVFGGFVVLHNGEPAGFTVWEHTVSGTANGIAGLSRQSVKGMSEFQTVTACRMLRDEGIKYYNIGGSETEGLNRHKLEYRPEKSIQLHSYDVAPADFLQGVQVQTLIP